MADLRRYELCRMKCKRLFLNYMQSMCQASVRLSRISGLFFSVHAVMLRMSVRLTSFLSAVFSFEAHMPICLYFIACGVDRGAELQVAEFVLVLRPIILVQILQYLSRPLYHISFFKFCFWYSVSLFLFLINLLSRFLIKQQFGCKVVILFSYHFRCPR
jgi:hypothetical protein